MAIARNTTVETIKPLNGSIIRRYTIGATIIPGEVGSMQSDGFVDPANTTAAAQTVVGVCLPTNGSASFAAGDRADFVVYGPVVCVTGATPGATVHASDTAGEPAESAGTNAGVLGYAESATVVFVRP